MWLYPTSNKPDQRDDIDALRQTPRMASISDDTPNRVGNLG
jgi:hypothetical protein